MTERQIEKLVARWQPRLGLNEWKIEVVFEEFDDPETAAEAENLSVYQVGRIRFNPQILKEDSDWIGQCSPEENEVTVVHELLHLVVHPMKRSQEQMPIKGENIQSLCDQMFEDAEETVVDKLARTLVKEWKT